MLMANLAENKYVIFLLFLEEYKELDHLCESFLHECCQALFLGAIFCIIFQFCFLR